MDEGSSFNEVPEMCLGDIQRFYRKADMSSGDGGCWIWKAASRDGGYGSFKIGKKLYGAHRVSYRNEHGPIPAGMCVLHRCDNPKCVNPAHLFLGTHADNAADREAKGRGVRPSRAA